MIKQNTKLTKKERSLRSALGKVGMIQNHLKKLRADLAAASEHIDDNLRLFIHADEVEEALYRLETGIAERLKEAKP